MRGVDLDVWKAFQKSIIDKYGNLYGYLGPEVTSALKAWMDAPKPETKRLDITGHMTNPAVPRVLDSRGGMTVRQVILNAMKELGGEATIQEVTSFIHKKYGDVNASTISTDMSDLSINGPRSSLYPMNKRILKRVARGRYRLLEKDGK